MHESHFGPQLPEHEQWSNQNSLDDWAGQSLETPDLHQNSHIYPSEHFAGSYDFNSTLATSHGNLYDLPPYQQSGAVEAVSLSHDSGPMEFDIQYQHSRLQSALNQYGVSMDVDNLTHGEGLARMWREAEYKNANETANILKEIANSQRFDGNLAYAPEFGGNPHLQLARDALHKLTEASQPICDQMIEHALRYIT